ncbi:putative photosynthetic complex assembly protein PuhE [Brevundimonas variabilis]|uniref:Putative photosynthetic complex assembly protein 2 n=1 Tax=Brevundimonas variabilis TaxID=74312 RepID=A0A7W9CI32_9CAUL|nr:putative photosynthetic complex assembly protein PuhE [Brevundimonas variabilis]MBB5746075.1 putative photosynthetic complex assembly protein 2 [Brevundimonas variabilis]
MEPVSTSQIAVALATSLLLWWFSTGAILWLVRLPRAAAGWTLGVSSVVALLALIGLVLSARDTSVMGAYGAFGFALTVWGWHELGFLMGKVTGPRRTPCPPTATGWTRFRVSAETVIHHEIALALTAVLVVALAWGQPNQTGTLTFVLLLGMRLSTKLNIYLGVRNPPITFLPTNLTYLQTYFRRARFNALFPLSLALSVIAAILLRHVATDAGTPPGEAIGASLMLALTLLGLLEHAFLMTPSPDRTLWGWALGDDNKQSRADIVLAAAGERDR